MPRLYIIDPYLLAVGGHYYEYDLHLGKMAESAGYHPVIVAHRDFTSQGDFATDWKVLRVFTGKASITLASDVDQAGIRLGSDPETLSPEDRKTHSRLVQKTGSILNGLRDVFEQLPPSSGDRIFLPTVTHSDLPALGKFWRTLPESLELDWHLQFHFPFLEGRKADYAKQQSLISHVRETFEEALPANPPRPIRFYTTVRGLAEQYHQLGVGTFETIPYSINPRIQPRTDDATDRVKLVCAGHPRSEKGKKQLRKIEDWVATENKLPRELEMVVQRKERPWQPLVNLLRPIVSPRRSRRLRYAKYPLPVEAYAELIRSADLGVFAYDSEAYFARCSGVFLEMLQAGVPVVVPAGCWLSDQLSRPVFEYLEDVARRLDSDPVNIPCSELKCDASTTEIELDVPTAARQVLCSFRANVDDVSTYLRLNVGSAYESNRTPNPSRITNCRSDGEMTRVLLTLPEDASSVKLSLQNAYDNRAITFSEIQVQYSIGQFMPESAAGVIFSEFDDITAAIAEIVRHYDHYRQTARSHSTAVRETHSPEHITRAVLHDQSFDWSLRNAG